MKKFVLIPDSFKGTMSSVKVCSIMEQKINEHFPDSKVVCIPVADGGEGSVDCFITALGGQKIIATCSGPFFDKIDGFFGLINDGKTAVIEMAACAGLPMVEDNKNPALSTTFGVGELILHAVKLGAKKVIVGLGGSCTNDMGCGAASACGVKFLDANGKEFIPVGGTLSEVKDIVLSDKNPLLDGVEIEVMCDIDNPPFGKQGAAHVFAPQKGADERMVEMLDEGVKNVCAVVKDKVGIDLSTLKGGGAAGAMGAGMVAFFNGKLKMGINTVLDTVGFEEIIKDADMIFTGEGKIDSQSLRGKVVIGVSRRAKEAGVPVISVVGGAEGDVSGAYEQGVSAVFTINKLPQDFSISKNYSEQNLAFTVDNILRTIKSIKL